MNILIIDQSNLQTTLRINLLTDRKHTVTLVDTFTKLQDIYQAKRFDIVIIDFDLHESEECIGKMCLDYIDSLYPHQKLLTLSSSVDYSDNMGCDHCVATFNRKRLNKPTPMGNIIRLIERFDDYPCDHYHKDIKQ